MNITLSIIVAAHREGLIAHKTMRSLERATSELAQKGVSYEVIVTIDNGDEETHRYFDSTDYKNTVVHKVSFGELAASRNYGVSLASGKYIATLDADDLISINWLADSVALLQSSKDDIVLHTEYSINFGTQDIIWEKFNSRSKDEDAVIMTWANRWDSAIMAPRDIFKQFPYEPNNEGYGSEDWLFNSQTLAANIAHKVTPKTILFVRRKDVSMMTIQAADRRTVRYTDLLDFDFLRTINTSKFNTAVDHVQTLPPSLQTHVKSLAKNSLKYAHSKAKGSKLYLRSTEKVRKNIKTRFGQGGNKPKRLPEWLISEWRQIHLIEKSTFPDSHLVESIPLYHSEMYDLGINLVNLAKQLTAQPNYLVFLPHLVRGGAELVALRYIRTLKKQHPDWHIAVIATESGENPWIDKLPKGVDFVTFGDETKDLSQQLRLQLMARFIVQSKATHLHIAQSPLMFIFAALYKSLLAPRTVYAFAFCEDEDNEGRIAGHVHSGLPYAYSSIDKIFTDCTAISTKLVDEYGYSGDKFHTHYQPVETAQRQPKKTSSDEIRVLWASRISKQKRPDILTRIGKALDGTGVSIDIYGSFQDGYTTELFEGIESLSYIREFNGIDDLPTDQYDAFLYTSENDGMPNAILEAAAKGLAVVAPNIGGISEFINNDTGKLIMDNEDTLEYIEAIKQLQSDPSARQALAENAQKLLSKQHSLKNFESALLRDIT